MAFATSATSCVDSVLRRILIAAGGTLLASSVQAQPSPAGLTLPNGVASGDTTQTSTALWARATALGTVNFTYALASDPANILGSFDVPATTLLQPVKLQVSGLLPATRYVYTATDSAGATSSGQFRTPAEASVRAGLRLAISGDWRGDLAPFPSVRNLASRDPDLWVSFGDTAYADVPSPDLPIPQALTLNDFRVKQNEVYSSRLGLNTLRDVRESTSILAVIDDHEVTNDFAGGEPPASDPRFSGYSGAFINETELFLNGVQAFQEFNPINNEIYGATGDPRTAGKIKMYRERTYGQDAAIIMLDTRTFRDQALPAADPNDPASVMAFLVASFNPARTMLGSVQIDEVKADLLEAQQAGVTWKFVLVPEPIQNLGVLAAGDRFEGYAAERSELLRHIAQNDILNVVFVAADIHGTLVNNVNYQDGPGQPQIATGAFEISTGAVAYDAPFGPTVAALAAGLGVPGALPLAVYLSLQLPQREAYIQAVVNAQVSALGYDPLGLSGSDIDATLLQGGYTATNTYGWSEFQIDALTQNLTITTFGVTAYTAEDLASHPDQVTALEPAIVSSFTVRPLLCRVDVNRDRLIDSQDFFDYLALFFAGSNLADHRRDGVVNSQDVFEFLADFLLGC